MDIFMMKPLCTFRIGSSVFFQGIDGFASKDTDYVCLMDNYVMEGNSKRVMLDGDDVFMYRNLDKEGFIEDALSSDVPMRIGKFLTKDFCDHIGFTVDDLPILKPLIEKLDDKHRYEEVIYHAYIDNGGFFLTDEQRSEAYVEYKKHRE